MLLAQMTLANKITVVEGQGTSEPYVFYMAAQPALCIPALGLEDGPNGVGDGLTGVTQLPAGVSLAATFDPALARQYGQVIGRRNGARARPSTSGPRSTSTGTRAGDGRSSRSPKTRSSTPPWP